MLLIQIFSNTSFMLDTQFVYKINELKIIKKDKIFINLSLIYFKVNKSV